MITVKVIALFIYFYSFISTQKIFNFCHYVLMIAVVANIFLIVTRLSISHAIQIDCVMEEIKV